MNVWKTSFNGVHATKRRGAIAPDVEFHWKLSSSKKSIECWSVSHNLDQTQWWGNMNSTVEEALLWPRPLSLLPPIFVNFPTLSTNGNWYLDRKKIQIFRLFFFDTCIKFLCGGYFRKICWTVDKCLNWASFFFISSQYSMMNYRFDWSIDSFKLNEIGIFTRLLMHFMLWVY